jgi:hypothetical protein
VTDFTLKALYCQSFVICQHTFLSRHNYHFLDCAVSLILHSIWGGLYRSVKQVWEHPTTVERPFPHSRPLRSLQTNQGKLQYSVFSTLRVFTTDHRPSRPALQHRSLLIALAVYTAHCSSSIHCQLQRELSPFCACESSALYLAHHHAVPLELKNVVATGRPMNAWMRPFTTSTNIKGQNLCIWTTSCKYWLK